MKESDKQNNTMDCQEYPGYSEGEINNQYIRVWIIKGMRHE